jgi:hypothetical protein
LFAKGNGQLAAFGKLFLKELQCVGKQTAIKTRTLVVRRRSRAAGV